MSIIFILFTSASLAVSYYAVTTFGFIAGSIASLAFILWWPKGFRFAGLMFLFVYSAYLGKIHHYFQPIDRSQIKSDVLFNEDFAMNDFMVDSVARKIGKFIPEKEIANFSLFPGTTLLFDTPLARGHQLRDRALAYYDICNASYLTSYGPVSGVLEGEGKHFYLAAATEYEKTHPPLFIFHHGAGANFFLYTCLLSKLASDLHGVVIAPSRGFGSCDAEKGEALTRDAVRSVAYQLGYHPKKIYQIGLSNGGCAALGGLGYKEIPQPSTVLISPVIPDLPPELLKKRKILVLHGVEDAAVPSSYITERIGKLSDAGASIVLHKYKGEDHFLMLSQAEAVIQDIKDFIHD